MSDTHDSAENDAVTQPLTEPLTEPLIGPFTGPTVPLPHSSAWTASVPTERLRPRVRAAAIVWGVIVSALAGAILFVIGAPERRTAVAGWIDALTGESIALLSIVVGGAIILLVAVLGAIRRAERRGVR